MKPIVNSDKTYELKIIRKSDLPKTRLIRGCEKGTEIKLPEKEKADKELQLKSEDRHSVISISSDDFGSPVSTSKQNGSLFFQRYAFDNNALIALRQRKDTIVLSNNLEGNNMGNSPTKVKQFFCGSNDEGERRRAKSVEHVRQRFDFSITNGSDNNSMRPINLNDINNSFEVEKANKKMLNGINNGMEEFVNTKVNDAIQKWENKLAKSEYDMNKKLSKIEKIRIKIKILADNKIQIADNRRQLNKRMNFYFIYTI